MASAADAGQEGARLRAWLGDGFHGDMEWMAETPERRASVPGLWSEARSVVMLAMSYAPEDDPLDATRQPDRGTISVYARGRDYHEVLKGRLKTLAGQIAALSGADAKAFVDTAPLMEKPLATRAGLGWQGKNTLLISREHGGWLFLGAIVTAAPLPADPPETDHCGGCTRCLDACPTAAFPAPYVLDARRCISYLTIEHRGVIPRDLRPAIGNRIFGCDDCLAVCPWNKFAQAGREAKLAPRPELDAPTLGSLSALDDAGFRAMFSASPVKRSGRDRFVRNVLVAIGNSNLPALASAAEARLADTSPLVRGMAVWALGRLLPEHDFVRFRARRESSERDEDVRAEWARA